MKQKLTGEALLNKINSLPNNSVLTDRVDACGYYYKVSDGSFKCDYDAFFAAVKKAEAQSAEQ